MAFHFLSRTAHETRAQYLARVDKRFPGWRSCGHSPMADGVYVLDYAAYVSLRK